MAGEMIGSVILNSLTTAGVIAGAVGSAAHTAAAPVRVAKRMAESKTVKAMGVVAKKGYALGKVATKGSLKLTEKTAVGMGKLTKLPGAFTKFGTRMFSKTLGMMGLNFSLSSLLRQSQLFTGTMGALYQILGGFVDVILAPFMPLLKTVIAKLGSYIPVIASAAQTFYDWLAANVFPVIRIIATFIKDKIIAIYDWVVEQLPAITEGMTNIWDEATRWWAIIRTTLWPIIEDNIKAVWAEIQKTWFWIKDDLWPKLQPVIGWIFDEIVKTAMWIKDDIIPIFNDLWNWLKPTIEDILDWWNTDFAPIVSAFLDEFRTFISETFGFVIQVAKDIWDIAWPHVKPIFTSLGNIATELLKWWNEELKPLIDMVWDKLKPHIDEILGIIRDTIQPILDEFMDEIFNPLWEALKPWLELIINVFDRVVIPVGKVILRIISRFILKIVWPMIKELLKVIVFILKAPFWLWEKVLKPGFGWLKTGWDWLVGFFKRGYATYLEFMGDFLDALPSFLGGNDDVADAMREQASAMRASMTTDKTADFKAQEIDITINTAAGGLVTEQDQFMSGEHNFARFIGIDTFNTSGMTMTPHQTNGVPGKVS